MSKRNCTLLISTSAIYGEELLSALSGMRITNKEVRKSLKTGNDVLYITVQNDGCKPSCLNALGFPVNVNQA